MTTTNLAPALEATLYFSYNQFLVYDKTVKLPACEWTSAHAMQGFARRDRNVALGSLLEFGHATVRAFLAPYAPAEAHARVIEVPLEVVSGDVVIAGPEEFDDTRIVKLRPGPYRLTVAQTVVDDDREDIELFFEELREASTTSRIIRADAGLKPPTPLLEWSEVGGV